MRITVHTGPNAGREGRYVGYPTDLDGITEDWHVVWLDGDTQPVCVHDGTYTCHYSAPGESEE